MSQSKSGGSQTNQQSDNRSEEEMAKQRAGQNTDKSSHERQGRQGRGRRRRGQAEASPLTRCTPYGARRMRRGVLYLRARPHHPRG